MFGPCRDRIAQLLAEHALEGLAVPRSVQMPQHVVQGPVLEQHEHDVIHRVGTVVAHRRLLGRIRFVGGRSTGAGYRSRLVSGRVRVSSRAGRLRHGRSHPTGALATPATRLLAEHCERLSTGALCLRLGRAAVASKSVRQSSASSGNRRVANVGRRYRESSKAGARRLPPRRSDPACCGSATPAALLRFLKRGGGRELPFVRPERDSVLTRPVPRFAVSPSRLPP